MLETEHALVMLLLLYGLLTYRGPNLRWAPLVVLAGILLSVFTPVHQIELFWPVITGLVVPPLLWQGAVAVTRSGPLYRRWSLAVWGITLVLITLSLFLLSALPLSNALLLGILAVTLVWYLREVSAERSYLSTIGMIALVVLLVDIDLVDISLRSWVSTLISGLALGIALGFIGITLFRKLKHVEYKNWYFLVWGYVAYLTGTIFGTSAIATTLAAALVVAVYGYSTGLWATGKAIPVSANTPFFFYLSAIVWIVLGWQAHTVIEFQHLAGIPVVLALIAACILVVRQIVPISDGNRLNLLLRQEIGVLLLLLGSMLLWPREAFLTTVSVEIALAAAVLLIVLLRIMVEPLFELFDIRLSWPTEHNLKNKN